jgi:drug/metabolite transporter (DMT)-like permease
MSQPAALAINRPMSAGDWTRLVVLSIVWGGSFLFIGVAVKEIPPLVIVTVRVMLAASALWIVLFMSGVTPPRGLHQWRALLGMSLLNNTVPFSLFAWAQAHIPSSVASILNATTPLFLVLVAHVFTTDERMSGSRVFGVVAGFVGVAAMLGAAPTLGSGIEILAELACLAAALCYAFSNVYGRRFKAMGIQPLAIAAGQLTMASLVLLPITLVASPPWTLPTASPLAWACVAALALPSTAFAYVLFFRLLASAGATNLGLVTFLIPVTAVLLGVTLLGEDLALRHVAGMSLIALGLAAIDGRPWRRLAAWLKPLPSRG